MNLLAQCVALAKDILTDSSDGFSTSVTFTTANGEVTKICDALAIRHSTTVNEYGAPVKGTAAFVTVAESALLDVDFPTRDANNKISLVDNLVSWVDVQGDTVNYIITEIFPDHTLGVIRCTLGIYS
jgi:hypothetical protein